MTSAQSPSASPHSTPSSTPSSPDHDQAACMSSPAPHGTPASSTCRYAGKKCLKLRALKRNGSLHNLCHYHRVRANQNQRRMELRRRIQRVREEKAMGVVHRPAWYAVPGSASASASASAAAVGSFSAMMLLDEDLCAMLWGHFGGLPPANGMLPPPPPHDRLSELFVAPSHDHFVVDLPCTTYPLHKHDLASHNQYPAVFPPPVDYYQQVVWRDQDPLLPL